MNYGSMHFKVVAINTLDQALGGECVSTVYAPRTTRQGCFSAAPPPRGFRGCCEGIWQWQQSLGNRRSWSFLRYISSLRTHLWRPCQWITLSLKLVNLNVVHEIPFILIGWFICYRSPIKSISIYSNSLKMLICFIRIPSNLFLIHVLQIVIIAFFLLTFLKVACSLKTLVAMFGMKDCSKGWIILLKCSTRTFIRNKKTTLNFHAFVYIIL